MSNALPGMIGGAFALLLGVLCFAFNRKVGGWLRRYPLLIFGAKAQVEVDEIIFRGLACLLGLLYAGVGLMLLAQSFS
jgi:hypothetical protein